MADEKIYQSIDKFYEIAKEEYNYQRNRTQRVEDRTKFIITLLTPAFTFELANASNVLYFPDDFDSCKNILKFIGLNIPYFISILTMSLAIIIIFIIIKGMKYDSIDVFKFYNKKLPELPPEKVISYYTMKCLRCTNRNRKRINKMYKRLNVVIAFSVISVISFGLSYLF